MISTGIFQWLFIVLGLSIWITYTSSKELRVVCYYTNWSVYRPGTAKFSPQNINPYLCTHLIYAFGGFTKENTLKPFDKYQDIEKGGYAKFTGLKTYNKNLKTLLAIGGWNEASSRFSPMVASADRRKQLVKNSIKFLRQNHFDGLDLDWEYPAFREGGKPKDKENYAKLVQELREEFERESEKTGRSRLLLTMAVPAGIEYINKGYDIPKLTKYLDWMNILSYDYHSAFEPAVNHHAPLYPLQEATEYDYDGDLNIDFTIKHYLELGADPSKLVLGIPTYGRSYTLFNPEANALGDPADGPGEMGEATRENGYLAYYEICENIKSNDWSVVQPNEKAMGPYAFKENQWVGYDDDNIVRKKAEYVAKNNLGGIMFWAIDNDDFRGNCHGKPYPLIEAAKEALISSYGLDTEENSVKTSTKSSKPKNRNRSRPKTTESTEVGETTKSSSSGASRRRNRNKSKQRNNVSSETRKIESTSTHSSLKISTPAYTTPEPPSTPDQGGGFKCEDEGFFPHPKDCKKYFWCLSGPGELGIVAHQFTCPAGLYFNKAADSCDYSQNVLCNKKLNKNKSTTTTTTTTTAKPKSTSRFTTARTTTTTTEEPFEDEYEYDDEEDEGTDPKIDSEEDPRVIKELLDLIKKAGGIENLEKQLHLNNGEDKKEGGVTTPSTRTKSIVEKFLSNRNEKTKPRYSAVNRNSRGPQNEGLSQTKKAEPAERNEKKPQYTSILRRRPSSSTTEKQENEEVEAEIKQSSSPKYTSIRRIKGTTTGTSSTSERTFLDRNKILGEDTEDEDDDEGSEEIEKTPVHSTPQYVNIRRSRPTTDRSSSTPSRYVSIRRSTTTANIKPVTEEEIELTTPRIENPTTAKVEEDEEVQTELPSTTEATTSTTTTTTTTMKPTTAVPIISSTSVRISISTTPKSAEVDEIVNIPVREIPVVFEPRPFTAAETTTTTTIRTTPKPQRHIIRTAKPISNNKLKYKGTPSSYRFRTRSKTTQRPRPKSPTSTLTIITTTPSSSSYPTSSARSPTPTTASRRLRISTAKSSNRRKYPHPHFTKIESQEHTTAVSPKRIIHVETQTQTQSNIHESTLKMIVKPTTTTKTVQKQRKGGFHNNNDQSIQSSNQEKIHNNSNNINNKNKNGKTKIKIEDADDETTELSHTAFTLLTKAPLPYEKSIINTSPIVIEDLKFYTTTTPKNAVPIFTTHNRFNINKRPHHQSIITVEKMRPEVLGVFKLPEDYDDYLDDYNQGGAGRYVSSLLPRYAKVILHSNGDVECLDQGSFPHPASCKKFISCAMMDHGKLSGYEYTCPKNLSFDPIGGICNWSAGLGCNEK